MLKVKHSPGATPLHHESDCWESHTLVHVATGGGVGGVQLTAAAWIFLVKCEF